MIISYHSPTSTREQSLQWWEIRVSWLFGKVWDRLALSDVQGQTGLSIPNTVWNGETALCVFSALP